jgi:TPR repeat protein
MKCLLNRKNIDYLTEKKLISAANKGDIEAKYNLAVFYWSSMYFSVFDEESNQRRLILLEDIAPQYPLAQFELGMTFSIFGASRGYFDHDGDKVFYWLSKAADNKVPEAIYHLAKLCYIDGDGVKKDFIKALDLLEKANRMGVEKAKAQIKNVFDYYERRAQEGYPRELCDLAYIYWKGIATNVDYSRADFYYKKLLTTDNEYLHQDAGRFYLDDKNPQKDYRLGIEILEKIANDNINYIYGELVKLYYEGEKTKFDSDKVKLWLQKIDSSSPISETEYLDSLSNRKIIADSGVEKGDKVCIRIKGFQETIGFYVGVQGVNLFLEVFLPFDSLTHSAKASIKDIDLFKVIEKNSN